MGRPRLTQPASNTPNLPDSALPGRAKFEPRGQAARNERTEPRQSLVRDELLAKIRESPREGRPRLSQFILNTYAGGTEADNVDHAKLTLLFERLTDISNGIHRVQRVAAFVGEARYSAISHALKDHEELAAEYAVSGDTHAQRLPDGGLTVLCQGVMPSGR